MNILITHLHLTIPHGSENWTHTIANELINQGHKVYIWSPKINQHYWNLYYKNCILLNESNINKQKYDVAILQQTEAIKKYNFWKLIVKNLPKRNKVYAITESVISHDVCKPCLELCLKGANYIGVSEEIRNTYECINKVWKQPIAEDWFNFDHPTKLNTVLYASHRHDLPVGLEEILDNQGIELITLGKNGNYSVPGYSYSFYYEYECIDIYKKADLVIGTGRWIYQSMSAGIPCIVANSTHVLGYVVPETIKDYEYYNMTLRNPKKMLVHAPIWQSLIYNYNNIINCSIPQQNKYYALDNYHVTQVIKNFI